MIDIKKYINLTFIICIFIGIFIHFKDSWQNIWSEVLNTSLTEIFMLCVLTILYFVFDSLITFEMAIKYNDKITFKDCLFCSFYCTFLGIATMGSGAGIGEIHYFHSKGIDGPIAGSICIIKYVLKK
ncbi:MAG: hypothetical protein ACK5LC_15645 [Coprobacillaceae bacterium]